MKKIYRYIFLIFSFFVSALLPAFATEYAALVEHAEQISLSLPVSGVIKTLNVVAGQHVKQGEEILTLNPLPFQLAITQAKSQRVIKQTRLTQSLRDLKNQKELFDRTLLSTVRLEDANLKVKRDRAYLKIAQAELAMAEYKRSVSKITAPFNAIVLSVFVNKGQAINNSINSKILVTLTRQNKYVAKFTATTQAIKQLKIGQTANVKIRDKNYPATISRITKNQTTNNSQSQRETIELKFSPDNQTLHVGEKVMVNIK